MTPTRSTFIRSALFLLLGAVTHCAGPAPAFAQEPNADAVHAVELEAPHAPTPPVPDAPAPDAIAPVDDAVREAGVFDEVIETWFRKHFHGLGARLDTPLYNLLHAAKEDLLALLNDLDFS